MRWSISLLLLLITTAVTAYSQKSGVPAKPVSQQRMEFHGQPPSAPIEILGNSWRIYATGEIDADAATRLEAFIKKNNIPEKSILALHSPGGSLLGGMKLGQVIRDAGLFTYVGRESSNPNDLMRPGECYSACALAFLGGEFRWIYHTSMYGVHRFNFIAQGQQDIDVTQILSASIVQYIRDMGVDPSLFSAMTSAGSDSIKILSQSQLKQWKVVNNGYETTTWTVETVDNALYLKGVRNTWRGVNKFMLVCAPNKPMFLYVIFDPEGRSEEVLRMKSYSLFIGDKAVPISAYLMGRPFLTNGWINVAFSLDKNLLTALRSAKEVGVAFQFSYDSPLFAGFSAMDFSEGAKKLPALVSNCPVR